MHPLPLVQACQVDVTEHHPLEQALDKPWTAVCSVAGAGQVDTAQCVDALVTVSRKRQFDKQTQPLTDLRHVPGKVQHPTPALAIALQMQALDQFRAQALQQGFKGLAYFGNIGPGLAGQDGLAP